MSSTGGGLHINANSQVNWSNFDTGQNLTLHNVTNAGINLSQADAQALADQYIPNGGDIALNWDGSTWSPA